MPGIIGSGQLASTLPKFIAEARLTLSQEGAMKNAMMPMPLSKKSGLTLNIPTWTQPTAYTLTEGIDMAQAQQISDSNVAIQVAENAGVQVLFTWISLGAIREDALRMAARSMANAIENKRDRDLLTLLSGFNVTLGGSGVTLGAGHLLAAKVRLLAAVRPIEGAIQGIFHPFTLHSMYEDLANIVNPAGKLADSSVLTTGIQEDLVERYEVTNIGGIKVFSDPNVPVVNTADAFGGIFAKAALIYVPYEEESILDDDDPSLRATEVNMVATYGFGEYEGRWGFNMLMDRSTPGS